jgi:hypothetical protein
MPHKVLKQTGTSQFFNISETNRLKYLTTYSTVIALSRDIQNLG